MPLPIPRELPVTSACFPFRVINTSELAAHCNAERGKLMQLQRQGEGRGWRLPHASVAVRPPASAVALGGEKVQLAPTGRLEQENKKLWPTASLTGANASENEAA